MSKMLDKVSKLLNQAENAGTPAEAETFMAKAMELAQINAIDLAVARMHQAKKERAEEPEERRIACNPFNRRYNRKHYIELAMAIADANDCEYLISGGDYALLAVGFPSDLDVVEALFTHLSVQMATECDEALARGDNRETKTVLKLKKEPIPHDEREWGQWNGRTQYYDDDPDDDVYIFRGEDETAEEFAQREQAAILAQREKYEQAVKNGTPGNWSYQADGWRTPVPPPKVREVADLDENGEKQFVTKDVVVVEGRIYRNEFYEGFVSRMRGRLMKIKATAQREAGALVESSETGLALRDKKAAVDEAHAEQRKGVRRLGTYNNAAERNTRIDYSGKGRASGQASAERVPVHSEREVRSS